MAKAGASANGPGAGRWPGGAPGGTGGNATVVRVRGGMLKIYLCLAEES